MKAVATQTRIDSNQIASIAITGIPTFIISLSIPLRIPSFNQVRTSVIFNKRFFTRTPITRFKLPLSPTLNHSLIQTNTLLGLTTGRRTPIARPRQPRIDKVSLIVLRSNSQTPNRRNHGAIILARNRLQHSSPTA